ncbi:EthD domain-containing protein [Mycolicibacterium moriokaense]|uniref:EthD domain-containing protein n=1 Tax=Mycolicibacterium moriokaense TaxID=39691 RepID=A0A318H8I9_9MYCO|nr:EthD domain-containing protein [Mycolicibacterium moriokaense]PXX01636.1 hypothetical protein C8E89_12730 [Mycolicibacterium moriokaense]
MEKVVYVATRSADDAAPDAAAILTDAREVFAANRFRGVSVHLPRRDVEVERDRVRGTVLTQMSGGAAVPRLVAVVSLWVDCADDLLGAEQFLAGFSHEVSGYAVTEAVSRWWAGPDGPPTQGVNAVTLMRRNPAMTQDQFLRHWAQVHMPISLRYHPQWRYIRNAVVRTVVGDKERAPHAIAEEGFATPGDLIDPMKFYGVTDGTDETLAANKKIVFEDVPVFLDVSATATFVTEEHVIRSAWTPYAVCDVRERAAATS